MDHLERSIRSTASINLRSQLPQDDIRGWQILLDIDGDFVESRFVVPAKSAVEAARLFWTEAALVEHAVLISILERANGPTTLRHAEAVSGAAARVETQPMYRRFEEARFVP